MADPQIIVVFHSTGMCPTNFAMDLAKAMRYTGNMIPYCIHEQSCYVDSARNKLVKGFLANPKASHMMMIDVDVSFEPGAFLHTYEIMHSQGADVVFGNYALGNSGNSIFGPPENKAKEAAVLVALQPNTIYTDIATGGTGWLMATRQILERMQQECPGPWHWFARDLTADGSDLRGEDVSFGLRLYNMKPKPKVIGTTAVMLRHIKAQPFVPEHMAQVAVQKNIPALAFKNPYEDPKKFIINGHQVIAREALTPEQIKEYEDFIAKGQKVAAPAVGMPSHEGEKNAEGVRGDEGQVCEGGGSGQPGVRPSAVESCSDLQQQAQGSSGDGERGGDAEAPKEA